MSFVVSRFQFICSVCSVTVLSSVAVVAEVFGFASVSSFVRR